MTRFFTTCTVLFAGYVCLFSADSRCLQAAPETSPSVVGTWRGGFGPVAGPSTTPSVLIIPFQDLNGFFGTLWIGNVSFRIAGAVSSQGEVLIGGEGELGILIGLLYLHVENGVSMLDGRLLLQSPSGQTAVGDIHLVRSARPQ